MKICDGVNYTPNININDLPYGTVFVGSNCHYRDVFMRIFTVSGDDKENAVSLVSGRTYIFTKKFCETNHFVVKPNACLKLEG